MRSILEMALVSLALNTMTIALGCASFDGASGTSPDLAVCTPNTSNKCLCSGSKEGVQTCAADGSGFSLCDCGSGAGGGGAGKAGGVATGGGSSSQGGGSVGGSSGQGEMGGSAGQGGSFPSGTGGGSGAGSSTSGGSAGSSSGCVTDGDCEAKAPDSIPPGCVQARCESGLCAYAAPDVDGDEHGDANCKPAVPEEFAAGDDCNDADAKVFPGAWDGPLGDGKLNACDGKDDDCSGTADDQTISDGSSCSCTLGETRDCSLSEAGVKIEWPGGAPAPGSECKYGKQLCVKGPNGAEWETKCTGAVAPKASDNCNGLDEDCDGVPDSPPCACIVGSSGVCETSFSGKCKGGTRQCEENGVWGACTPNIVPAAKDGCDSPNNDDNCNGSPFEGCACTDGDVKSCGQVLGAVGVCANGTTVCNGGQWGSCSVLPSGELCDNNDADENCNGSPNDGCSCLNGQTQGCNECGDGVMACSGGQWGSCAGGTTAGQHIWYLDADGDGWCGGTANGCSPPGGYTGTPCQPGDCVDGNPYANNPNGCGDYPISGPVYGKVCCGGPEDKPFAFDCGPGWHSVDCVPVRISGGGGLVIVGADLGKQSGQCIVRYSLNGLEGVKGYGQIICRPDGLLAIWQRRHARNGDFKALILGPVAGRPLVPSSRIAQLEAEKSSFLRDFKHLRGTIAVAV